MLFGDTSVQFQEPSHQLQKPHPDIKEQRSVTHMKEENNFKGKD